jgi:aminopeptidase-like protein
MNDVNIVEINKLIKLDDASIGDKMYSLICRLYPICRSITGDGVRETLHILREIIPMALNEIPTGTQVFDWTIPKEWNIKDAYIKNSKGERIVEFKSSNLHVVNYSAPVHKKISLQELKEHCHTLPEQPSLIPYRTSYYNETWGFCLSHDQLLTLVEDEYEVFIDSTLKPGTLTYGEYFIEGDTNEEILIYTHTCHPSLCNDNLSGLAVVSFLADLLRKQKLKYSYRFVFGPGTIGSITWLSRNEEKLAKIKHGLVIALVGDAGNLTYKKSRQDDTIINRAVLIALRDSEKKFSVLDFSPYGYDERQYTKFFFRVS